MRRALTPGARPFALAAIGCALVACGPVPDEGAADAGTPKPPEKQWAPELFATGVVSFTPGANAGYGQAALPGVVLGAPRGEGASSGSLDVLSLGQGGVIVLSFARDFVDGDGADLVVFENVFSGFIETAQVSVSLDAEAWIDFPCATDGAGCAGLSPVFAHPANGVDPTDVQLAGGDAFDLRAIGVTRARFVRITDSGRNTYAGASGGFDLDAVSVVHGEPR